jgi:ATP-binding cassette subfamily C (CFTR/MRP) protein 1
LQHLQETNEDSEDLEEIKKQLEKDVDDADLKAKLERAISRSRSDSTSENESLKEGKNLSRKSSVIENGSLRKRKSTTPEKKAEEQGKEGQNKLIEAEKAETGRVKYDVYKHYLKSIGWTLSISTILLNIIFQGFSIGSNIWLSQWSTDIRANETKYRNLYLGGYGAFGIGQGNSYSYSYKHIDTYIYDSYSANWYIILLCAKILCCNIPSAKTSRVCFTVTYIFSFR